MRSTTVIRIPRHDADRVEAVVDSLNAALPIERMPRAVPWTLAEVYRRAVRAGLPVVLAELEAKGGDAA